MKRPLSGDGLGTTGLGELKIFSGSANPQLSREIAEVLGISAAVVRPRLSRARGRLREVLGNDPPPAGHLPSTPQLIRKER